MGLDESIMKKFRCIHCGKVIFEYSLDGCNKQELRIRARAELEIAVFKEKPDIKYIKCINEECNKVNGANFASLLGELLREKQFHDNIHKDK